MVGEKIWLQEMMLVEILVFEYEDNDATTAVKYLVVK